MKFFSFLLLFGNKGKQIGYQTHLLSRRGYDCGCLLKAKNTSRFQQNVCRLSSSSEFTLKDIARIILDESTVNIVVMAGAGISTSSGIMDFRTPGTGLYDNLQKYNLPYPEAIFDINYFQMNPVPFFTLAKELYPGNYKPNPAHYFVKLLSEKNKLLRMYTQNIDGLERLAGIPEEKLIEAHGTFASATCTRCGSTYVLEDIKNDILGGVVPKCKKETCNGVVKPDIVFFGEGMPMKFFMHPVDMLRAELLIVMGTSLEVEPFASIANMVTRGTARLLINKELVGSFTSREKDVVIIGDIVEGINKLTTELEWNRELQELCSKNG